MRIGILGGTFDPIHIGHLIIAEQVREKLDLDKIWFMPARIPPHKDGEKVTSEKHRLEMVKLAIEQVPAFQVISFELERPGPSYTVHTVKEIKSEFPHHTFYFIIGGDMVEYLPHWHGIEELVHLIQFVGVERPGFQITDSLFSSYVQTIEIPQIDLSSTLIREKVSNGLSIRFLVTKEVERYIEENRLYEA